MVALPFALSTGRIGDACPTVTPQQGFNLTTFIDGKWFIHQQMPILYLPARDNFCVTAEYSRLDSGGLKVHNYANVNRVNGEVYDSDKNIGFLGGICADVPDAKSPAKLSVGPCYVPKWLPAARGPYWVLAVGGASASRYDWALISGGQPTDKEAGGCRTGFGINNSGLWIFTRSSIRDEALLQKIRSLAEAKGFDLSVLKDVEHKGCNYAPP